MNLLKKMGMATKMRFGPSSMAFNLMHPFMTKPLQRCPVVKKLD